MSKLIVSTIENVDNVSSAIAISGNPQIGQDIVVLNPSTHQNNYNLGIISSNQIHSVVDIYPGNTIVISGIDTSGFQQNKRFTLRNRANTLAANSYLIVLNRSDPDSAQANQIFWQNFNLPGWLMPGEEISFVYEGGNIKLTGGTRYSSGANIYDEKFNRPCFDIEQFNGAGSSMNSGNIWHDCGHITLIHDTRSSAANPGTWWATSLWPGTSVGYGSLLVTTGMIVQTRATIADDYIYYTGLSSHYVADTNWDVIRLAHPHNMIGCMYDIQRANDFIFVTAYANTYTWTALNRPIYDYTSCRWAAFINGDGTRVDFLQCPPTVDKTTSPMEKRNLWGKSLIIHTTNIPKARPGPRNGGNWTTAGRVVLTSAMAKRSTGLTRQYVYTSFEGLIGGSV